MLTTGCTNSCEWCFAKPVMDKYRRDNILEMQWKDFIYTVDFYKKSNVKEMVLLGGEPTLHSMICEIITYLEGQKIAPFVITNASISENTTEKLAQLSCSNLRFAVNSTSYFNYSKNQKRRVDSFFQKIGSPIILCYTITQRDIDHVDVGPILDRIALIMKYALEPHIQLQIAVPCENNTCFIPFDRYDRLYTLLENWGSLLRVNNISTDLDCHSFPLCILNDHPMDNAYGLTSKCNTCMIEIGPDLSVWPCMPLWRDQVKLQDFQNFEALRKDFKRRHAIVDPKNETVC